MISKKSVKCTSRKKPLKKVIILRIINQLVKKLPRKTKCPNKITHSKDYIKKKKRMEKKKIKCRTQHIEMNF